MSSKRKKRTEVRNRYKELSQARVWHRSGRTTDNLARYTFKLLYIDTTHVAKGHYACISANPPPPPPRVLIRSHISRCF